MGRMRTKRRKNKTTGSGIQLTIEEIITELADSKKRILNSTLAELSNLSAQELKLFLRAWAALAVKRRRQIISRLVELVYDNVEFNFDSIFENCLDDQDADVRSGAIEGLWENEKASLIDPLISLLEQDSSEKVQAAAATALGKFAMLAENENLRPSHTIKVSQALISVNNDKSKPVEVRRRTLEAVAPLSLPQVKLAINEAYQSDSTRIRVSSIYAMGKNCDPQWLPILLKELNNDDPEMRYEAVGACGELEEAEAVPYLVNLVNDPDTDVQLATIRTLGKIGGAEAKTCLKQCLNNPNQAVSQAAEQALVDIEATEDSFFFKI